MVPLQRYVEGHLWRLITCSITSRSDIHAAHAEQFPLAALSSAAGSAPAEGIHHHASLHNVIVSRGSDLITEALATLLYLKGRQD